MSEEPLTNGLTRSQIRRLFVVSIVHYIYCIVTFIFFFMTFVFMMAGDQENMESYFLRGSLALMGSIATGIWRVFLFPKNEDEF
jgi:hypothetical protein